MKKNLITVIILAICLINLAFNVILVFVFMPSASKTNKLITDIATVLDLEIKSQKEDNAVDLSTIEPFTYENPAAINLADDGSGTMHVLKYDLTINLNTKASDYKDVEKNLQKMESTVQDTVRNIIAQYNFAQVNDVKIRKQIKDDVLIALRKTFNTECIYSIDFSVWVAQ